MAVSSMDVRVSGKTYDTEMLTQLPNCSLLAVIDFKVLRKAYIYFCCGYTSVVCLVAITLNRLVGIVYPLHYKVT